MDRVYGTSHGGAEKSAVPWNRAILTSGFDLYMLVRVAENLFLHETANLENLEGLPNSDSCFARKRLITKGSNRPYEVGCTFVGRTRKETVNVTLSK